MQPAVFGEFVVIFLRIFKPLLTGRCPTCKQWTTSLHSRYIRTICDLPLCGYRVILRLNARKFRCRNSHCTQRIFTDRFPNFIEPSQRKTKRLRRALEMIGLVLGGRAGSRLCRKLNMPASGDSLLRLVRQTSVEIPNPGCVVGIDDWAYCRGHRYKFGHFTVLL
jgi:hypothetical protein